MKLNKRLKKGELTTEQIVLLIILILSFAVILFFLIKLNLPNQTESQLCHNSVSLRGTSSVSKNAVPLNCQKTYICISKTGKCNNPDMNKPTVEKVSNKDEVYHALAENLANCWWMYGEGKVNYIGSSTLPKLYCSMCSQIGFDSSVKRIFGSSTFDKKEFYNYLALTNMSGSSQTYSQYLYGTNNFSKEYKGNFGKVDLTKQYYSLIGITSDVSTLSWAAVGAGLGVLGLATGGLSNLLVLSYVGGAIAVGSAGGAGVSYVFSSLTSGSSNKGMLVAPVKKGESGNDFVLPSLIQVNSPQFDGLGCQEIANKA